MRPGMLSFIACQLILEVQMCDENSAEGQINEARLPDNKGKVTTGVGLNN
jgi:hypothetical protein